jgi:glutathione S-transferase
MAAVQIYGVPPSTFTRTVRLACHERGVDYELVPTPPSAVHPHNPFGKIPAMKHGDVALFESQAIVRYLDRAFPGPKLWPTEGKEAAACDQWASAICDSLASVAIRFILTRFGIIQLPEDVAQQHLARTRAILPIFDKRLGEAQFLAGDSVTAADLYLLPIFFYFPEVTELKELGGASPNCLRWAREIGGRPSVKATDPQFKGLKQS